MQVLLVLEILAYSGFQSLPYIKLNFQQSTVSWKLFSGRFINAVMTVHASSIAEYGRVALDNNSTPGADITQYASTK